MNPKFDQAFTHFYEIAKEKKWDTPVAAWRRCGEASASFCTLLRFHCIPCRLVTLTVGERLRTHPLRNVAALDKRLTGLQVTWKAVPGDKHCVVEVEGVYYDWSRRQYQPDADFPVIATREQMEAEGWEFAEQEAAS